MVPVPVRKSILLIPALVPARDSQFLASVRKCWFLFLSGTAFFLIPASGSFQRLLLPGSGQGMMIPVPFKKDIILLPNPATGSCQIQSIPGPGQAMMVPVPVRYSIFLFSGLRFLSEIVISWFWSSIVNSCS